MSNNLPVSVLIRRLIQVFVSLVIQMAVLFIAAGSLQWPMAWVYLAISVAMVVFNTVLLYKKNPDLITERTRLNKNTKGWDKILALLLGVIGPLLTLVIVGLDRRFSWTMAISSAVVWGGVLVFVIGMAFLCWSMVENRFFACTVAIQDDRGHSVISTGPYAIVRHPGYTALGLAALATPIMFESLWGLIPAAFNIIVIIVRTSLEDRTLQYELPGYKEFTKTTPSRLVPGLW
jgi:protein-S-isoprenylcysteine O-methyltransferase Ste14